MIIKQALRVSSLLWVILLLPEAGISEDLSVPIEWYYGRWPSGHAAEGHRTVGELKSPSGFSAYTYSNGRIKAGVNRFENLLIVSDNPNRRITADATFAYRPSRNWQISLESLQYRTETRNRIRSERNLSSSSRSTRQLDADFSVDWSNKSDVSLSPSWQRYMEYVSRTTGQGQWMSNLSIRSTLTSGEQGTHSFGSTNSGSSSSMWSQNRWEFRQTLLGAISDRWHISLIANNRLRTESFNSTSLIVDSGSGLLQSSHVEQDLIEPSYKLSSIFNFKDKFFIEIAALQEFRDFNSSRENKTSTLDTLLNAQSLTDGNGNLQETQTTIIGQLNVITEGDFVSGIVLDDYAGYYHKMLFAGQYHGQLSYEYNRRGDAANRQIEIIALRHTSRYGLLDRLNLAGSIDYEWEFRRFGERVSSRIDLQWRSYDYQPGSGPGWLGDSPLDIQYGPIKRPGHIFLSVSTSLPTLISHNTGDFLSFKDLQSDDNWQISSTLVAGLPWQSEVRATSLWQVLSNKPNSHDLRVSFAKRWRGKLEFSLEYLDTSRHLSFDDVGRLIDDFDIMFNVRGLL